ncbi:MAG: hypothetical protein RR327_01990 [Clostridia bacterium]
MTIQLVTADDCINNLGVNIAVSLGQTDNNTNYVNNWLVERQDEILDYIGEYAWGGRVQAEKYLEVPQMTATIKRAVLAQVQYCLANANQNTMGGLILGASDVKVVSVADRLTSGVAPRAVQILNGAQLLYGGRLC